jgi:hypothetical protein
MKSEFEVSVLDLWKKHRGKYVKTGEPLRGRPKKEVIE